MFPHRRPLHHIAGLASTNTQIPNLDDIIPFHSGLEADPAAVGIKVQEPA